MPVDNAPIDDSPCLRNASACYERHLFHHPRHENKDAPHQQKKKDILIPVGMGVEESAAEIEKEL